MPYTSTTVKFSTYNVDAGNHCLGSGMFIPVPYFYPSRIPDLGLEQSQQRKQVEKIYCPTFFCSKKYHKINQLFYF
jgi:hypothetical protein